MRRIVAGGLAMLALVGGGLLTVLRAERNEALGAQDAARESMVVSVQVEAADLLVDAVVPGQPAAATIVPPQELLAADVPLRDRVAQLDAAARAGDARAACTLGAELHRCATARFMAESNRDEDYANLLSPRALDDTELQREIDALAAYRSVIDDALDHCAGVSPDITRDATRYIAMAALAGHRPSQVKFLTGDQLRAAALLRDATPLQEYRTHAGTFFRQALESGDLEVLRIWYLSLGRGDWPLAQYLPPDLRDRGVVVALIDQLTEDQRDQLFPSGLPWPDNVETNAEQITAAKALHARYFADSRLPRPAAEDGDPIAGLRRKLSLEEHRCNAGMH